MDRTVRLVLLTAFIVISIIRFIRYSKAATSKRPPAAIPGSGGMPPPASVAPPGAAVQVMAAADSAAASPIQSDAPGGIFSLGPAAALAAIAVWVLGNAAVWLALFTLPQLTDVPVIWRLVTGVIVSFYLIRLARVVGRRVSERPIDPGNPGGNPFPP